MPGLRRNNGLHGWIFFFFFFIAGTSVSQEALIPSDTYSSYLRIPNDMRSNWTVGFSALTPKGLSGEHGYLVHSIPMLLMQELRSLGIHTYTQEESEVYRRQIKEVRIRSYRKELVDIQQKEDELFFKQDTQSYTQANALKEVREYKVRKAAILDAIEWLEKIDIASIVLAPEKPLAFKEGSFKEGQEKTSLLDPPRFSYKSFSEKEEIDILVWGTVEEVQGYLYIKIHAYNAILDREVYVFENAGSAEDLHDSLPVAADGLAEPILGRKWARLTVIPTPTGSAVVIDHRLRGTGRVLGKYLRPGAVHVEVRFPGYLTEAKVYDLAPFEEQTVEIALVEQESRKVALNTHPEGADVYLDSRWQGKTPLTVDLLYPNHRLLIKKEGYRDLSYEIDRTVPDFLSFSLKKRILDETKWLAKKRDSFYTALGIWALSLPFPIFLYGSAVDSANAVARAVPETDQYRKYYRQMEITYFGYWITLFASVSLFVKMFANFFEYVDYVKYIDTEVESGRPDGFADSRKTGGQAGIPTGEPAQEGEINSEGP